MSDTVIRPVFQFRFYATAAFVALACFDLLELFRFYESLRVPESRLLQECFRWRNIGVTRNDDIVAVNANITVFLEIK